MVRVKSHHTRRNFWHGLLTLVLVGFLLFLTVIQQSIALNFGKAVYKQSQTLVVQSVGSTILSFFSEDENLVLVGITVLLVGIIVLFFLILSVGKVLRDIQASLNRIINLLQQPVRTQSPGVSLGSQERQDATALVESVEKFIQQSPQSGQPYNADGQNSQEQIKPRAHYTSNHRIENVEATEPLQPRQSESNESIPLDLRTFCDLYNAGKQSNLRTSYQPYYRIGVKNASERRRNLDTPPVFKEDTAGRFLAYYIESENSYAVVPRFDLTLQDSIYGPGAFGEVFECPQFNPQHTYRNVKVIQPAFFELDSNQQGWTLKAKGELDLGPAE